MSIKRYIAEKDTVISNAYKSNLIYRATGSSMGNADSMEIFSIYAQASTSSNELSRALIQFPISEISAHRTDKKIPLSGSVDFYLRLFNAPHPFTTPRKITLAICPLSRSFDEGNGLDCDDYSDDGVANWEKASSGSTTGIVAWTTEGGDFYTGTYNSGVSLPTYNYYMEEGYEDLTLNVTTLLEEWISNTKPNYGIIVKLTSSIETAPSSSYTKKFYARSSEYFFKRPCIEARWDSSKKDNRGNFYASSSLVDSENLNTLYLYNYARGQLRNIPAIGTSAIYVKMWTDDVSGSDLNISNPITGGYYETGIYTASFALDTTSSYVWDRWYGSGLSTCYHTGSRISIKSMNASSYNPNPRYIISMPYLRDSYQKDEEIRLDVSIKDKNWNPNKYTVMNSSKEVQYIEDLYYGVKRVQDNLEVLEFGTGSINNTRLSYDVSGSYFDFDFGLLEEDYMYEFKFCYKKDSNNFEELKNKFRFRVDK